ncbi:MAG: DNA methyltransferase [Desulfurococcaceae archaeon]
MKIAYVCLPTQKIQEIESGKIEFLKKDYGIDLSNYDFLVVYKSEKGAIKYYGAFEVVKKGTSIELKPRKKLKRPVDNIHKYWARKPWWAVSQYILTYSKEGDVVCDPMCGSGIIGYEALRTRRRAIMVDLNPFAIFLARNTIKPLNTKELLSAYEEVLNRPLDRNVTTEDGKIIISKGTPVKDAIRSLYKTRCRICGGDADVVYYVWDTTYKPTGKTPGTDEGRILLEALRSVKNQNTEEISQLFLLEKWEVILEKAKELCEVKESSQIQNIFKGPPRPSSVTDLFGKLVREGVYVRVRREPKYLYYICRKNSKHEELATVNEEDNELISKIEKAVIPFQYPTTSLSYPNGKLFNTARPDSLYVKDERLSTWTKEEFDNRSVKVHHLFTKRNLLALSILFWSIENVKDFNIRERLLLAFTSTLLHCSKMISGQLAFIGGKWEKLGGAIWMTNRYSIPPDFKEANVLLTFEKEFARIRDANDQALSEIGEYYKEAKTPDEFVANNQYSIIFLRMDARELSKIFKRYKNIVDMVFTDPPYGDAIQYFELCTFWTSWLLLDPDWSKAYGNGDWWQKEVVVNPAQGKPTLERFKKDLIEVFSSVSEIVKDDATWVITYHKREPRYWAALSDALQSIDLGYYSEERHELLGKSFNPSKDFRFLGTDAYTVWKKLSVIKIKTPEGALERFFDVIGPAIRQNNGILPKDIVEKAYVQMAYSVESDIYEKFFEGKLDAFLSKCTIQIPTKDGVLLIIRRDSPPSVVPLTKWQELWDKYYGGINLKALVRTALYEYIKGKAERNEKVSLDDIYGDIINRIGGRITKDLVFKALEEVAEYDWFEGTYKPKKVTPSGTLLKWIKVKEKPKLLDPPENLIPKIAVELIKRSYDVYIGEGYKPPELPHAYSRKLVKRIEAEFRAFPLVFEKEGKKVCIDINNLSRASQVLLKGNAKVLILLGNDKLKKRSEEYFKKYIDDGRLIVLDVRGLSTEEVISKILEHLGEK